jgi:hypothetical protein
MMTVNGHPKKSIFFKKINYVSDYLMLFTFVPHENFFGCALTVSFTYSALIFFKKTNYVSDYLMIYTVPKLITPSKINK